MKKGIIDRFLVMLAMFLLTFIFALLAIHYDIFAASFNRQPMPTSEIVATLTIMGYCLFVCSCTVGVFFPLVFLFPLVIVCKMVQTFKWPRHLYNVILFCLCGAFMYFAINLVAIYEFLSGEVVKQQATFGGFLAVLYAWIIVFGTIYLFYRVSGLSEAVSYAFTFFAKAEDAENKKKKQQIKSYG